MNRTQIKICGLTRLADIDAVNEASVEFAGFVFAQSRRRVTPEQAYQLRKRLLPGVVPVGVFVNAPAEEIISLLQGGIIEIAQLHGQEGEAFIRLLQRETGKPVIKAVRVDSAGDVQRWKHSSADLLLFDNGPGGTGKQFDWNLIRDVHRRYLLAGGLHEGNVRDAIEKVRPYAVDISSGVETDGVKDPQKILSIVRRIRE